MRLLAALCRPRAVLVLGFVLGCVPGFSRDAKPSTLSPEVTGITPFCARPGETLEVRWSGSNLQNPLGIWTSFGAKIEWVSNEKAKDGKRLR